MSLTPDVAPDSDRVGARAAPQWVGWLLATSLCLLAISLAWRWLCVGTYRLYLDERRGPEISAPVLARQRFDVAGGRVAPQIVSSGDERLSFPVDFHRPSELQLRVVPSRQASFEIAIVERGARRILCRRTAVGGGRHRPAAARDQRCARAGQRGRAALVGSQAGAGGRCRAGLVRHSRSSGAHRLRPAVRKARSPRVPAGFLGPHCPAGRSHRRRHCRPLPRLPGGRPAGDRGPPAHLDHGPAPEPGRGEHGSPLAGLGELRPPPCCARQHLLRVAAGRHRPHGVPPAGPRSPRRLPLPVRHRCRRLPQLRTGVAGHRGGGPGRLLHRRHDASGGADLAGTRRASPGGERSELRHRGLRARAGAARAEGIPAGAPRRVGSWSGSSPATTWWTRRGSRASSATVRSPHSGEDGSSSP